MRTEIIVISRDSGGWHAKNSTDYLSIIPWSEDIARNIYTDRYRQSSIYLIDKSHRFY